MKAGRGTHIFVCGLAAADLDSSRGTVAIMEGAKVIANDGKQIGKVERVIAKPAPNGPNDYLIAQALLLNEKQMLQVEWIDSLGSDAVRLAVGAPAAMKARRG
jgi:uncharacterized protein YrrD